MCFCVLRMVLRDQRNRIETTATVRCHAVCSWNQYRIGSRLSNSCACAKSAWTRAEGDAAFGSVAPSAKTAAGAEDTARGAGMLPRRVTDDREKPRVVGFEPESGPETSAARATSQRLSARSGAAAPPSPPSAPRAPGAPPLRCPRGPRREISRIGEAPGAPGRDSGEEQLRGDRAAECC